jgi:hypothetical protein
MLLSYVRDCAAELCQFMQQNRQTAPFANRLQTRLIVTSGLDAHKRPTAPKDVAVYYYLPGVDNEAQLSLWLIAIQEAWLFKIRGNDLAASIEGRMAGRLRLGYPVAQRPRRLTPAEKDQVYELGYSLVVHEPYDSPFILGSTLWRDGEPKFPSIARLLPEDPAYWSNRATPLALVY